MSEYCILPPLLWMPHSSSLRCIMRSLSKFCQKKGSTPWFANSLLPITMTVPLVTCGTIIFQKTTMSTMVSLNVTCLVQSSAFYTCLQCCDNFSLWMPMPTHSVCPILMILFSSLPAPPSPWMWTGSKTLTSSYLAPSTPLASLWRLQTCYSHTLSSTQHEHSYIHHPTQ